MSTDNPSAFPLPSDVRNPPAHPGMSLRDYFAAKAMEGFIITTTNMEGDGAPNERLVMWSYELADAMLVERAKSAKPTATTDNPIPSTLSPRTEMD